MSDSQTEKVRSKIKDLKKNKLSDKLIAQLVGTNTTTLWNWKRTGIIQQLDHFNALMAIDPKKIPSKIPTQISENSLSQVPIELVRIPVLGQIPAGKPEDAVEEKIGETYVSPWIVGGNYRDVYGLKVKGDSMAGIYDEGDIVIVKQNANAVPGDCVVAQLDGEYTLKILSEGGKLKAYNPKYKEICPTDECRVMGVVIASVRMARRVKLA